MIQIVEENEFFIVLVKPETYSVHNDKPSLVDYLTAKKKPIHFVNRLDQQTSGLMVVAQKAEYHEPLAKSLEEGRKIYRALLRGSWKAGQNKITLNWPLSDKAEGHKNPQGISADRVPSETRLELIRSNDYFSEVYAELITGRQHQIRKHCALAKQPIVGDDRYGKSADNERIAKLYSISRMQLHAEKLQFRFMEKDYSFEKLYSLDAYFKKP